MIISHKTQAALLILCSAIFSTHAMNTSSYKNIDRTPTYYISTSPTWQQQDITMPSAPSQNTTLENMFENRSLFTPMPNESRVQQPAATTQTTIPMPAHDIRGQGMKLQKEGNVAGLQELKQKLEIEKKGCWFPGQKKIAQEKIDFIDSLIKSPITHTLDIIKNGPIHEASAALFYLEIQYCESWNHSPTTTRYVAEKRNACGFDCVDTARAIFEKRTDYPEFRKQQTNLQKQTTTPIGQSNALVTVQSYNLDNNTSLFLDQNGLDPEAFKVFSGNALQQAIHQQYVDIVNSAADLHAKHHNNDSVKHLTQATVMIADVGCEINKQGFELEAQHVADFCKALLHHTQGVAIGACEGIYDGTIKTIDGTVQLVWHPIDSACGIISGLSSVICDLANNNARLEEISLLYEINPQLAIQRKQEISEQYKPIREAFKEKMAKMTVRDWSRATASIMTQAVLQCATAQAAGSLIKAASNQAHLVMQKIPAALKEKALVVATVEGQVLKVTGATVCKDLGGKGLNNIPGNTSKAINIATEAFDKGKDLFKFSVKAGEHMNNPGRAIPVQIFQEIIENPMHIAKDPRGSSALMYYSQMAVNGPLYNVEVLYDKSTNMIWHFLYKQGPMGPLQGIK